MLCVFRILLYLYTTEEPEKNNILKQPDYTYAHTLSLHQYHWCTTDLGRTLDRTGNTLYDSGDTCSGFVSNGSHLENKTIPWKEYVAGIRAGYLAQRENAGSIDALSNIKNKSIYLFSGTDDVSIQRDALRYCFLETRKY